MEKLHQIKRDTREIADGEVFIYVLRTSQLTYTEAT
jgi:hypothetical protein